MAKLHSFSCSTSYWLLCTFLEVQLDNLEISFPKWVRERNITSEVSPFANAVGNQEHAKNDRNCNHNYHYNLHLLLVFLLFMIDFAEERQKYFSNAIK